MGFEFKPSIWFVCRICRQAFRYIYKLKEHKVECHLGECLKTKCLIFEERVLDHEWIPPPDCSNELECKDGPFSSSAGISNRENSYKNPYVSLEPLGPEQLDVSHNKNSSSFSISVPAKTKSRSCRGTKRTADKLVSLQALADDEPRTEKKCNLDVDHVETTTALPPQSNVVFDSEVPKVELPIEELRQLAKNVVVSTSSSNLLSESSKEDEVCSDSQEFELEDREYIVASIVKSSDGTENIQFVSTHIPTTLTAAESTLQKQFGPFGIVSVSEINSDVQLLNTTDKTAAEIELPGEFQIHETTSDVLDFQIEKESNGHITLETGNLFKLDNDSICEPLSPEEYLPIETTNLSQTENSDEIVHDADNYECPDNIESRAEDGNIDQVIDPVPASQGHSKINQVFPSVVLTPEELSLPLLDWLNREKTNDPSNVILLDPDPTNEANETFVDVNNLHPMKCVLCKLKLTSETKVKEHVKVCWTLNKAKHWYCVTCKKTFCSPRSLKRHCRRIHYPIVSTPSRELANVIDSNESADFNFNQEEAQNSSQINSESTSNTFNSETDPSASRSRYSTRRHKSRVNYSETHACRGCAKDFYTVEDVEDHEKLCQLFRNKTKETKQAKETIDEEIQVIGSITKKNRTFEIASEEDDDKYQSPNSERNIENDDAERVLDRRPRSKGHSQINQILSTVTLSSEDLSLSLLDWITKERTSDPSNVILLDPDPTGETLLDAVNDLHPTKCVLCKLVLTSDTQVKEHVKVCWTFNKSKHVHCVRCQKTYCHSDSLKRHFKSSHVASSLITNSVGEETVDGTEAEAPDINSNTILTEPHSTRTRRNKRKFNYSETQACRGCAKDFYTVEAVEDHEKLCPQLKSKNKENKETQNKDTEGNEVEVIRSTVENTIANTVADDDDDYECPDSSGSSSDLESAGCVTDPQPSSHHRQRRSGAVPIISLTPEDLSLPLVDWLKKEKDKDASNVILLDPDPTNDQTAVVEISSLHPVKCVLCKSELTSDTQVKQHVKVCWHYRKVKHSYCVPCNRNYAQISGLLNHRRIIHKPNNSISRKDKPKRLYCFPCKTSYADSKELQWHIHKNHKSPTQVVPTVTLTPEEISLPLVDWVTRENANDPSNVILLDPDPTNEALTASGTNLYPVKCVLCKLELTSDTQVKEHVKVCWHFRKPKHTYCVPCKKSYGSLTSLDRHSRKAHKSIPKRRTPNLNLIPRKYDKPLKEWLVFQKQDTHLDGSSNVILIDQDPTLSDLDTTDMVIDKDHPMTCLLCQMLLFSDSEVRNHVENCWWHNKQNHRRCVPCEFTFETPKLLRNHQTYDHAEETSATHEESENSHAEQVDVNNGAIGVGLAEWLRKRQGKSSNVIRLDPDPIKATGPLTISRKSPVKCMLCNAKLNTEASLKTHAKMCWRYYKKVHRYCVPCEKGFSSEASLNQHNCNEHFPGPKFPYNCTACRTAFNDRVSQQIHRFSRLEFLNQAEHGKYAESSTAGSKSQTISLGEWLKEQKKENPSNSIVLEPDPLSTTHNFEGVSEANPVKCKLCFREFTAELLLRSHVKMCWIHNRRIHRHCVQCNKTYENHARYKIHKKRKHRKGPKPMYECNVCGRKYLTLSVYKAHQESHVDLDKAKPFKCATCHNSYQWKSLLDAHMPTHSSERNFKCPHCPKTFIKKSAMKLHLAVHTLGKDDPTDSSKPSGTSLNCKFCDRFFTFKEKLKDHERSHTGERPYKCKVPNCSHTFSSLTYRIIHTKRKHGQQLGLTRFLCSSCGKTFPVQSELDYHVQRWHTEAKDKPFKCPHEGCSKRFGMKFQIAPHMLIHSGEKPFQCEQCGRAFASKQTFKKHQLTHDDEGLGNKITCQLCPKAFRENGALKRHLKHHEGKLPKKKTGSKLKFKCKFCGKGYYTKPGLRKHEATHDDDEDESEEEEEEEKAESDSEENETSESSESENSDQDSEENSTDTT